MFRLCRNLERLGILKEILTYHDGVSDLPHDIRGVAFRDFRLRRILNSVEELAAWHALHYQKITWSLPVDVLVNVQDSNNL
jgi:hypothetical protein